MRLRLSEAEYCALSSTKSSIQNSSQLRHLIFASNKVPFIIKNKQTFLSITLHNFSALLLQVFILSQWNRTHAIPLTNMYHRDHFEKTVSKAFYNPQFVEKKNRKKNYLIKSRFILINPVSQEKHESVRNYFKFR